MIKINRPCNQLFSVAGHVVDKKWSLSYSNLKKLVIRPSRKS